MSKVGVSSCELSTLRALTYRLSSTPTTQLPQQIPSITASLANCKSLLSSSQSSGSKGSSDASVVVHRYRTSISTLLQDRTTQGRWAAIVLVKATIEIGGWETLQKSLPWVRHLLEFLTKPDSPSSKKLCIITLTRIFLLTREYPTLVREITTPSLPTYIQKCMQIAMSNSPASLLQAVLESFNQLLPRHPTIFRSYLKQIQQLLGQVLSITPSNKLSQEQQRGSKLAIISETVHAAQQLYVQLSYCAPKNASSEEWDKSLKGVVSNAHSVANKVFRAVIEDWQSPQGGNPSVISHALDDEVQDLEKDSMDLLPWTGIYAGGERLVILLQLVKEHLCSHTPGAVALPLGLIMDLATRMLSLTVPTSSDSSSTRINIQVSKEERENLWSLLPQVHITTMEILLALMGRCEKTSVVLDVVILEQLGWVFEAEQSNTHIRTACYLTVAQSLIRSGPALPKSSIESLATLIRACCNDVLQLDSIKQTPTISKANGMNPHQVSTNADKFLKSSSAQVDPHGNYNGLRQAAFDLLPILISYIRPQHVSDKLITTMHRIAVLAQHKDAMIASVLNPLPKRKSGKVSASLLPLLGRSFGNDREVECFVRPRIPVIRIGRHEDEAEHEPENDVSDAMEEDDDHFVGAELDTLLESASHTSNNNTVGDNATSDVLRQDDGQTVPAPEHFPVGSAAGPSDTWIRDPSPEQNFSKNKRPQNEDIPPSPTKRVKFDVAEDGRTMISTALPTAIATSSSHTPEITAVFSTQPDIASHSSVSAPPVVITPAGPTEDNSDDNDDDFGELVLGQDTDEESD